MAIATDTIHLLVQFQVFDISQPDDNGHVMGTRFSILYAVGVSQVQSTDMMAA